MIHLTTWPMVLVEGGLALFCLLDALLTAEPEVRWLPRFGWVIAILFFPVAGCTGWVCAGRPWRHRRLSLGLDDPAKDTEPLDEQPPHRSGHRPYLSALPPWRRPDPDPGPDLTLMAELSAIHDEHDRTMSRWEESLRRREAALRRREDQLHAGDPAAEAGPAATAADPPETGAGPGGGATPPGAKRPDSEDDEGFGS